MLHDHGNRQIALDFVSTMGTDWALGPNNFLQPVVAKKFAQALEFTRMKTAFLLSFHAHPSNIKGEGVTRGEDQQQRAVFSYASPASGVPKDHPFRPMGIMADNALADRAPLFRERHPQTEAPVHPFVTTAGALLPQVLQHLDYNLLFLWFVGLSMDDRVWDHTTFSKYRDRLIEYDAATAFFRTVKAQAERAGLLSNEPLTVAGTLNESFGG